MEPAESIPLGVVIKIIHERMAMFEQGAPAADLSTGLAAFDRLCGGIRKDEVVVLGGRPGMGKTSLALALSLGLARASVPVLYFSPDLSPDSLTVRMLAAECRIPAQRICNGPLEKEEKEKVLAKTEELSGIPFHICGEARLTSAMMEDPLKKMTERSGECMLAVLDHLQLLRAAGRNREQQVAAAMRGLKLLARAYKTPFLVVSQLSRGPETRGGAKRPELGDLRESGAIEQEADKVILLYRPEYYGMVEDETGSPTGGRMELILAKNRSGPCGTANLHFDTRYGSVRDYDFLDDPGLGETRSGELKNPF